MNNSSHTPNSALSSVQQAALLAAAIESLPDALLVTDLDGYILAANARYRAVGGPVPPAGQPIGEEHIAELLSLVSNKDEIGKAMQTMVADPAVELSVLLKFLDARTLELQCQPLMLDGQIIGRVNTLRDESERVDAKRRTDELAGRLASVVGSAMDSIVSANEDQRIILFNEAAAKTFGWSTDEVIGQPLEMLIPARYRETHAQHVQRFGATGQTQRSMHGLTALYALRRDGTEFPIEASISHTTVGGKKVYTAILRDVTERLRAEEELRESRAFLEEAQEIGRMGNWTMDLTSHRIYASRQNLILFGNDPDIAELSIEAALENVQPEDLEIVNEAMSRAATLDEPLSIEFRLDLPDGIRWIRSTVKVIKDEAGRLERISGVSQDITEQKRAAEEHRKLEQQLRQAQKLEAVGTLAGGIAHDFNNMLFAIQGYAEMVLDTLPLDSVTRADQLEVLNASHRAGELVRQILTFSRRIQTQRVPVRVGSMIKEVCKLLRASLPTTIELSQNLEAPDTTVLADPIELHQVLMNLCTNAAHAIGDDIGTLEITLRTIYHEQGGALAPGRYCLVTIADSGCGIAPENLERIFEPFFTTKDVGEGTGLGLAMVHGIVTDLGGKVSVYSELGIGTTFQLYIPLSSGEAPEAVEVELRRGTESVLVVDDEPVLARLLRQMLTELGYSVQALSSPLTALELFRDNPKAFDLVITDETMPRLRGTALAAELRALRTDIPIILCTGQAQRSLADLPPDITRVLIKPIGRAELSMALREVLDGER